MRHYLNNFDDNCYELTVLRWFRDNFVFKEDIKHYYKIAPVIVEAIDKEQHSNMIYDYIYDNVVDACVTATSMAIMHLLMIDIRVVFLVLKRLMQNKH